MFSQVQRAIRQTYAFRKIETLQIDEHLKLAMQWLKQAQDNTPDDGVSQKYLIKKAAWANSYPETTGYIIPTFYRYWHLTGDNSYRDRAIKMSDWESQIQTQSGGVVAGSYGSTSQPTIFNTGQVLFGWVTAYQEEKKQSYLQSAIKAANWLCDNQDTDGCWRKFGSPFVKDKVNTYNTRTAWGVLRVFDVTQDERFRDSAIKNLDWALTQRNQRGWLSNNCLLDNTQPYTHTIAYAMRGFLEVAVKVNREDFLHQVIKMADSILTAIPDSGFLPGRFDQNWQPTVKWSCLTGNSQLAIIYGRLYQITSESRYLDALQKLNHFNKKIQLINKASHEIGAIQGAYPIYGDYQAWAFPNWAAKFFADALMLDKTISEGKGVYSEWHVGHYQ